MSGVSNKTHAQRGHAPDTVSGHGDGRLAGVGLRWEESDITFPFWMALVSSSATQLNCRVA